MYQARDLEDLFVFCRWAKKIQLEIVRTHVRHSAPQFLVATNTVLCFVLLDSGYQPTAIKNRGYKKDQMKPQTKV